MSQTIKINVEGLEELSTILEQYETITTSCVKLLSLGVPIGIVNDILKSITPEKGNECEN